MTGIARDGAVQLVNEMARRFRAGDHDGAFDLLHPEFRIQQPESLPHGGWHHGRAGMVAMGAEFARHWDRAIGEPRVLDCGGSAAVQITTQTWTAKSSGRAATVDVVELFSVADGRIAEIRVFQQDTHALLATLDEPGAGRSAP
ncbi:nuclear transport factor 2 family protein [Actinomadura craniellae]|uniref:Nuclear transport factor 2 family protein n=1 Tax=Actinomadura craniellae TaxID=2231787 RepID=A0A365H0T4_9ACTN|nr:nuclear transport factor 2 family protein [Actinomadura craniellae]RAY12659.1 nuclear transport factor 2 family protein [Actinomadura craniellae]